MHRTRILAVGLAVVALLGVAAPAQAADHDGTAPATSVTTSVPTTRHVVHHQVRRSTPPARRTATRTRQRTVTRARPRVAAPAAGVVWSTHVSNSGLQPAIDQCAGGLTRLSVAVEGHPYYAIHEWCGGRPILALQVGQRISIDGATYQVTAARAEPTGTTIQTAAAGLPGTAFLQTCISHAQFRVVAITAV